MTQALGQVPETVTHTHTHDAPHAHHTQRDLEDLCDNLSHLTTTIYRKCVWRSHPKYLMWFQQLDKEEEQPRQRFFDHRRLNKLD